MGNKLFEVNNDDLVWFSNRKGRGYESTQDVLITINKSGEYDSLVIRFKKDSFEIAFGKACRLRIAFTKNRIYFQPHEEGYKASTNNETSKVQNLKIAIGNDPDKTRLIKSFIGDYSLKFSEDRNLYYIEKEN